MRTQSSKFFAVLTFMVIGLLVACGGGSTPPAPPPAPATFTVSGAVSGSVTTGVTVSIAPTPTGGTPWVTTDSKGVFTFTNVPNGTFVFTPYLSGHTFTPVTATIVVNGANVTGVNFNSPLPVLNTGKLLYAGNWSSPFTGVYTKDLSSGSETLAIGSTFGATPNTIVPLRGANKKVAFRTSGGPDEGIVTFNLVDRISVDAIPAGQYQTVGYLSTTVGSFDAGIDPTYGNVSAVTLQNTQGKDIFLILLDGTRRYVQVTTDSTSTSPVIAGITPNGDATVLFLKNNSEVWKVTLNTVNTLPNPAATLYKTSAMDGTRPMSINADYTLLAWTKNVGGVGHIIVTPLAGGTDLDLGPGSDPSWSLSGNGMLLFTSGNALWAVNPDGTGKIQVPTPTNLLPGALATVVFGPAGF